MIRSVYVLGAGGHGREVADIVADAARRGAPPLGGFLDDDPARRGAEVDGIPVAGDLAWLAAQPAGGAVVVAVGRPEITRVLLARVEALGLPLHAAISPHAVVSPRAEVAPGAIVFPTAVVGPRAVLAPGVTLNVGASASHDAVLSAGANINPGARLAGNVLVGAGAYVGMMAAVIQGLAVGEGAVVGAGAVVLSDVPPGATVVGVPARVVRKG